MECNINGVHINKLAFDFAQNQNQGAFSQLYRELYPFILVKADRACQRAIRTGVNIPREDFISFFSQGLFQATSGYDINIGDFMPRYQVNLRLREADAWRCYETRGTKHAERRYEKARFISLDTPRSNRGEDTLFSYSDAIMTPVPSSEQIVMEREHVKGILKEFEIMNRKYAQVIKLIDIGCTMQEIAGQLGENGYNPKMRKLIQRSKQKFAKFLQYQIK
ncbi:hypothetical protein [Paenibacillus sp. L3-i20]|uniref:hypothetical protein n=1 Tax=Paenibacillus sp. L3-i20 TaxID=2905833 RepID=UPI001EDCF96B|nr:hypothetical protein [Paenibacillus sp. L3-i20]GKU76580.1 hypothetical protein L3i20_v209770 [Paenibacillus sp. L3-i20]